MDKQKFEALENALTYAKCPKDFFGDLLGTDLEKTLNKKIAEQRDYLKKVSKGKKDANQDYRTRMMTSRLGVLATWAIESVVNGTYNDKLPYRVKLEFAIKTYEDKKYFLMETTSFTVFSAELVAVFFEGYLRNDVFRVMRGQKEVTSGYIIHYGTHAGCEHFQFSNGGIEAKIKPDKYEIGDTLEIETWRYKDADKFLKMLIRFNGLSRAIDSVFKDNNNQLSPDKLFGAAKEGLVDAQNELQNKQVFFV